jgi:hypothetical protein
VLSAPRRGVVLGPTLGHNSKKYFFGIRSNFLEKEVIFGIRSNFLE